MGFFKDDIGPIVALPPETLREIQCEGISLRWESTAFVEIQDLSIWRSRVGTTRTPPRLQGREV